jgi:hypothetical protein
MNIVFIKINILICTYNKSIMKGKEKHTNFKKKCTSGEEGEGMEETGSNQIHG